MGVSVKEDDDRVAERRNGVGTDEEKEEGWKDLAECL